MAWHRLAEWMLRFLFSLAAPPLCKGTPLLLAWGQAFRSRGFCTFGAIWPGVGSLAGRLSAFSGRSEELPSVFAQLIPQPRTSNYSAGCRLPRTASAAEPEEAAYRQSCWLHAGLRTLDLSCCQSGASLTPRLTWQFAFFALSCFTVHAHQLMRSGLGEGTRKQWIGSFQKGLQRGQLQRPGLLFMYFLVEGLGSKR